MFILGISGCELECDAGSERAIDGKTMCCDYRPGGGCDDDGITICPFLLRVAASWTDDTTGAPSSPYPRGTGCVKIDMDAIENQRQADLSGSFAARYLALLETITQLRPRLHTYCSRMTESPLDGEDLETWLSKPKANSRGDASKSPSSGARAISEWQSRLCRRLV